MMLMWPWAGVLPLLQLQLLSPGPADDLSGIWTGGISTTSSREILLMQKPKGGPASDYEMLCRTTNWETSSPCGWQSARCNVAGAAVKCDAPVNAGTLGPAGGRRNWHGDGGDTLVRVDGARDLLHTFVHGLTLQLPVLRAVKVADPAEAHRAACQI